MIPPTRPRGPRVRLAACFAVLAAIHAPGHGIADRPPAPAGTTATRPGPDPACATDGCLRWVKPAGDFDKAALVPYLQPGASIDNGYSVYNLGLYSAGEEVHATVAVPYHAPVPAGGWHVVANNHGTMGLADACEVSGTIPGVGLAALYGAHGMVGVAPEYPGLGTHTVHPYLVADSEAHAVLDALRATRALAAWKAVPLSGRYAVTGLSQGGHATLATAMLHRAYAPDVDIRAFAAAAPATAWEEHWRIGIAYDGDHLVTHAMLIYAWADHYKYSGPPLWAEGTAPALAAKMHGYCAFSFDGKPTLGSQLGTSAGAIFSPAFLAAYRTGRWGDYAAFHKWFEANRIRPYSQTAPLRIYQGDADNICPEAATHQLVDALRAGGVKVDYQVVPGGTHYNTAFGFAIKNELRTADSLAWLRARLDGADR